MHHSGCDYGRERIFRAVYGLRWDSALCLDVHESAFVAVEQREHRGEHYAQRNSAVASARFL